MSIGDHQQYSIEQKLLALSDNLRELEVKIGENDSPDNLAEFLGKENTDLRNENYKLKEEIKEYTTIPPINREDILGKLASIEANAQNTFKFMSDVNAKITQILSLCYQFKGNGSEEKIKLLILPSQYCKTDKPKLTTIIEDDDD